MTKDAAHKEDFKQLMEDLANGSEDAAWRIARDYTPHILRAVRAKLPRSIRSKVDSQDFAQIIWVSVLLKQSNLDRVRSPQELINLLVRVAHHKVVDAYRHYTDFQARDHRRESPIEKVGRSKQSGVQHTVDAGLFDRQMSPSQSAGVRERWQLLLQNLSPRDGAILRHRMNGETYTEIAGVVGAGVTTVREVLNRIVAQLRDE